MRALNTSGRAVLFAGGTVCVALLGLLVLRLSFLNGLGIGAAVTVVFSVLAAVTLLPALLGFFGIRVLSRRERRRLAAEGPRAEDVGGWLPHLSVEGADDVVTPHEHAGTQATPPVPVVAPDGVA